MSLFYNLIGAASKECGLYLPDHFSMRYTGSDIRAGQKSLGTRLGSGSRPYYRIEALLWVFTR